MAIGIGRMNRAISATAILLAVAGLSAQRPADQLLVTSYQAAMIAPPPAALGLDPFYRKYVDAFGIPIVSSEKVDDAALLLARDIVNYMLAKRPDVRAVMLERKSRVLIMAQAEFETDLP